jgi:hypothetical protein
VGCLEGWRGSAFSIFNVLWYNSISASSIKVVPGSTARVVGSYSGTVPDNFHELTLSISVTSHFYTVLIYSAGLSGNGATGGSFDVTIDLWQAFINEGVVGDKYINSLNFGSQGFMNGDLSLMYARLSLFELNGVETS